MKKRRLIWLLLYIVAAILSIILIVDDLYHGKTTWILTGIILAFGTWGFIWGSKKGRVFNP